MIFTLSMGAVINLEMAPAAPPDSSRDVVRSGGGSCNGRPVIRCLSETFRVGSAISDRTVVLYVLLDRVCYRTVRTVEVPLVRKSEQHVDHWCADSN